MLDETDEHYPQVTEPVPIEESFITEGGAANQVQAAALLVLARWLRPDPDNGAEERADRWPDLAEASPEPVAPAADLDRIGMPPLADRLASYRGTFYGPGTFEQMLGPAALSTLQEAKDLPESRRLAEIQVALWQRLIGEPSGPAVATLHYSSTYHRDPLVRTAAAAASLDSVSDRWERPRRILEEGLASAHEDVAELAAIGLRRLDPRNSRLRKLTAPSERNAPPMQAHTSLMVHGTFARTKPWWQPGGDFHAYISASVDGSLYGGGDRFDWSGGWSDEARALGALDLMGWVNSRGLQGLDLFSHSHGGNVALQTTRGGLNLGRLVLLSCPVHQRYLATTDPGRLGKVVSVRTRMDLVILADGGGQRFRTAWIQENRLPVWFKHSLTHDPVAWVRYGIPAMI